MVEPEGFGKYGQDAKEGTFHTPYTAVKNRGGLVTTKPLQ